MTVRRRQQSTVCAGGGEAFGEAQLEPSLGDAGTPQDPHREGDGSCQEGRCRGRVTRAGCAVGALVAGVSVGGGPRGGVGGMQHGLEANLLTSQEEVPYGS